MKLRGQLRIRSWGYSKEYFNGSILLTLLSTVLLIASLTTNTSISITGVSYYEAQIDSYIQLNHWLSRWPRFWQNITELGDALIFFPILSIFITWKPQVWVALFASIPLTTLLTHLVKHIAAVPRPAAVLPHDQFYILGKALTGHNSLPSGHTTTAFAIFAAVVGSFIVFNWIKSGKQWLILAGLLLAASIGLSRVAVGAHWPMDVLLGAVFGIFGGCSGVFLMYRFPQWSRWLEGSNVQLAMGIALVIWGSFLIIGLAGASETLLLAPCLAVACAYCMGFHLLATHFFPITVTRDIS